MKRFTLREFKYQLALKIPLLYGTYNGVKKKSFTPTYSQFSEDLVARKYLPENFGVYVDVGGGHPVIGSNTYLFSKRGYSGIVIEPITKFARGFYKRPSVRVVESICGEGKKEVAFYEFEESFTSTTSQSIAEDLIRVGKKLLSQKNLLPVALRDLDLRSMPVEPSLLDIDVEGADLIVLNSNDWTKFHPRVILVESIADNKIEIIEYLSLLGYKLVETCELTLVFVSKSYLAP